MNLNIDVANKVSQELNASEAFAETDQSPLSPTEAAKKLEFKLQQRPDMDFLKDQNIIKDGGNLASQKAELERAMTGDKISNALNTRPTADELVGKGILQKNDVPPETHSDQITGDHPTLT